MDLKLLPHLSDRALREEAEKRGVDTSGLDREALIGAIRDREGRAVEVPETDPLAPALPAQVRDDRPVLGAARALFGRVVGLARSALDRKNTPEPQAERTPPPTEEPIRTRSMARLLEQQGHLDRALAIVRELARDEANPELGAWAERLERTIADVALKERARAWLASASRSRVELLASKGVRAVAWHVDEAGLERARSLLGAPGALTLRVVRVIAQPDHSVESRQEDRRPLEASDWTMLDAPASARLVVSVGLTEGERFVSVAHAAG